MAKTLVIYYSRRGQNYARGSIVNLKKGNTEYIAEFIRADYISVQMKASGLLTKRNKG